MVRISAGFSLSWSILLLAGCVQTPREPVRPFTPEAKQIIVEMSTAGTLVAQCSGRLKMNEVELGKGGRVVFDELQGQDERVRIWLGEDLYEEVRSKSFAPAEEQRALQAYVNKRGIDVSNRESWCRAGEVELRENSPISRFLLST